MIDFILENKEIIILICEMVFSFVGFIIIFILNLTKKDSSITAYIEELLPGTIQLAETRFQDGVSKKAFAIETIEHLIKQEFPKAITLLYRRYISRKIETYLSTPQKKEVKK